jgi:trehalose 6-phosphate phosphatase
VTEVLSEVSMSILSAYHAGEKLALLFDYDGTLTPIVQHPWEAKLDPRTRELLAALSVVPHVHGGVFGGRRLDDLEQLVGLPKLFYCGLSGVEMRLAGTLHVHPAAAENVTLIDEMVRRLAAIEHVYPGAWVEHKRYGFAVHYRGVAAALVEEVHARILSFLERNARQLRIVDGPLAVEVTVAETWSKGDAVRRLVGHIGEPVFVVYAGDSATDASAFEVVTALGGVAVGVGALAPTSATAHLDSPEMLVSWLDSLLHALQGAPAEL